MPTLEALAWSADVPTARWLVARLGERAENAVTSIVPAGFEAYARVLHPADDATPHGRRLVRWRDVAAWSGRPLAPHAPFHSIAIPDGPVRTAPPWSGQGPHRGSLATADARALAAALRRNTRTPEGCWFCLWDGYGWRAAPLERAADRAGSASAAGGADDPIPPAVASGPRVELPDRTYFLYCGPVECALVSSGGGRATQTANLWWPEDRAWCVATEVDLAWTYVGGSVGLVRALVGDPGLEAVEVAPGDPVTVRDERIVALVQPAVEELMRGGKSELVTPVGTVDAVLRRPRRLSQGTFRFRATSALGVGSGGSTPLQTASRGEADLRQEVERLLVDAVIGLVSG